MSTTYANVLITVFISLFGILILSWGFTGLYYNLKNHKFAEELHELQMNESKVRTKESEKALEIYDLELKILQQKYKI